MLRDFVILYNCQPDIWLFLLYKQDKIAIMQETFSIN